MTFIEILLEGCNFYNVIFIYHSPDDSFYKTETWSGVKADEGFSTILSCVLKIYIQTSLKFTKTECKWYYHL